MTSPSKPVADELLVHAVRSPAYRQVTIVVKGEATMRALHEVLARGINTWPRQHEPAAEEVRRVLEALK